MLYTCSLVVQYFCLFVIFLIESRYCGDPYKSTVLAQQHVLNDYKWVSVDCSRFLLFPQEIYLSALYCICGPVALQFLATSAYAIRSAICHRIDGATYISVQKFCGYFFAIKLVDIYWTAWNGPKALNTQRINKGLTEDWNLTNLFHIFIT